MININELKQLVEYIANKHQSGANLTPNEFNIAVQSSLDDMLLYYYGLPQHYAPGAPMPAVAWEINQLVTDYMRALKNNPILSVDATGKMVVPSDYLHESSITYNYITQSAQATCTEEDELVKCPEDEQTIQNTTVAAQSVHTSTALEVPVEIVSDAMWGTRISHSITYPTRRYPVAKFMNTYVQYAPIDLGIVEFTYLRYPLKPVWAYTNPSGQNPVYDPVNSVDVEMPAIVKNHITYCVLTKLGINIRESQLQQYAEMMKKNGE